MLVQNGGVSKISGTGLQTYGAVTATSGAGSYGSWVQVTAATAAAIYLLSVAVLETGALFGGAFLLQIGVGAAASEVAVATIPLYHAASSPDAYVFSLPVEIATGQRVSVRINRANAETTSVRLGYVNQSDVTV